MTAHEAPEQWVSQATAAEMETAAGRPWNQSSVSRFLARNEDVPVRRTAAGKVALVEYGALVKARCGSLAAQDSAAARGEVLSLPEPAETPSASRPAVAPTTTRKRLLEEEKLELDLAERRGELLSRRAVTAAFETAVATFVQELELRRRRLAPRLVNVADQRVLELELKRSDNELQLAFAAALRDAAAGKIAAEEVAEAEAA